jgi:hypothetical protein
MVDDGAGVRDTHSADSNAGGKGLPPIRPSMMLTPREHDEALAKDKADAKHGNHGHKATSPSPSSPSSSPATGSRSGAAVSSTNNQEVIKTDNKVSDAYRNVMKNPEFVPKVKPQFGGIAIDKEYHESDDDHQ